MLKKNYFLLIKRALSFTALSLAGVFASSSIYAGTEPVLHYSFVSSSIVNDTVIQDESSNDYNAVLKNDAYVVYDSELDMSVLDLGSGNGYLDMQAKTGELISSLTDFSVCTYVKVGAGANLAAWGNMLWTFSNTDDAGVDANGYMFWSLTNNTQIRYAITPTANGGESNLNSGVQNITTELWHHVVISQTDGVGTIFIDGVEASNGPITMTPSQLGYTTSNYIGKPCYSADSYLFDTRITDFRVYDRAVTASEVLTMAGITAPSDYPLSLLAEREALDLGDLSNIVSDITLPTTGTTDTDVLITWTSTNKAIIDTAGVVVRPKDLDGNVILKATLSKNGYTLKKDFKVIVPATGGFDAPLVLHWDFSSENVDGVVVTDVAEKNFEGVMMNGAKVRKIGTTESGEFFTLDLGNTSGYFDMGASVGEIIYGLSDYTISSYFLVETTNTNLGSFGNFLWNFSNSDDVGTDQNGIMFGGLNLIDHHVSTNYYASESQSLSYATQPTKGEWHHMAYAQKGTTGTLYFDGVAVATGPISNVPSVSLVKDGLTGTYYNWIGRSGYASDVYLAKTLIYDFEIYNIGASEDDIYDLFYDGIAELNAAYEAASDPGFPAELDVQKEALTLGDISAVTANLTLPLLLADDVVVEWSTSNSFVIDSLGNVIRPTDIDTKVQLTAKLSKDGYTDLKTFLVTVVATNSYTSSLLLQYNFAQEWISGDVVSDAAEKHFAGTLMQGAKIKTIGTPEVNEYNVLDLSNDTAYFDMGEDVGKLIYALSDYSLSVYFFIDPYYPNLTANGNFIYNFSNGDSMAIHQNGIMFGRVSNLTHSLSSKYFATGDQTLSANTEPSKGEWHQMIYSQRDTIGTIYFDGDTVASGAFGNIPCLALPKPGLSGTLYNWIGRAGYSADAYLDSTLVYDLRLYSEAISFDEVTTLASEIAKLNIASSVGVGVSQVVVDDVIIDTNTPGVISVVGADATAMIEVYDITGRKISVTNASSIFVVSGAYIVKVNSKAKVVIVK